MGRITIAAAALLLSALAAPAAAAELATINLTVAHAWSGTAPCLTPSRQSTETIEARIAETLADAPRVDAEVRGFTFTDQPAPLVDAFRQLTRDMPRRVRPSECRDVLCAARLTFGQDRGPRLLLLASVYRYNASPLGDPENGSWTLAELDQLLAAFGDMPRSLFPLASGEYRLLAHREDRPRLDIQQTQLFQLAAEAGEGLPGILVRPGWHRATDAERRAIIVHEIAHEFTRARGPALNWRERWSAAAKADEARMQGADTPRPTVASAYAQRNLDEDFAESMTAYRYMAPLLKHRAPARYALLREWVFEGREYGSASRCAAPRIAS